MPHLLTLPEEIRNLVYELYLEDISLLIWQPSTASNDFTKPWTTELFIPGAPRPLSLTRVCRQVHAEFSPMVAPRVALDLGPPIAASPDARQVHPFANVPRVFLQQIRTMQVRWHTPEQHALVFARALSILPNLQLVIYYDLSLEIDEVLDDLPPHDVHFGTNTLRSIINLVNPAGNFADLRSRLQSRFEDIWEHDGPVSFTRMLLSLCVRWSFHGTICGYADPFIIGRN